MQFLNAKNYTPDKVPEGYPHDTEFFSDDDGNDWYQAASKFTKKWVFGVDSTGRIRTVVEKDASILYPVGLSIHESDTLPVTPDELIPFYSYINGQFSLTLVENPIKNIEEIKDKLLFYGIKGTLNKAETAEYNELIEQYKSWFSAK